MTHEQANEFLARHAAQLSEEFESVLILATWRNPTDDTTSMSRCGQGNIYAQLGMAHEFIRMDDRQSLAAELAEALED